MRQEKQQPTINRGLLAKKIFFLLILPVSTGLLLDLLTGLMPLITIACAVIFFPLAGYLVIQTALAEMDRVIQIVAPDQVPDQIES